MTKSSFTLFRRILTYRLTLYYLAAIVAGTVALAAFGIVRPAPLAIVFSVVVTLVSCFAVNSVFARVFGAPSHWESVAISALILTLIVTPPAFSDFSAIGFLVFSCAWAMAAKYVLAPGHRHIFNPAAFGVALAALTLNGSASWWVGDNATLLPLIIAGGALILTRLHYYGVVGAFAVVVLSLSMADAPAGQALAALSPAAIHSVFCFFAFVMLTEPRTVPLGLWRQLVYGALVGGLFYPGTHLGNYYFTPEVALLAGNVFTFLGNRRRLSRWATKWGLKKG